jgi:hypothetical protein
VFLAGCSERNNSDERNVSDALYEDSRYLTENGARELVSIVLKQT